MSFQYEMNIYSKLVTVNKLQILTALFMHKRLHTKCTVIRWFFAITHE